MAHTFGPMANLAARAGVVALLLLAAAGVVLAIAANRSTYVRQTDTYVTQPVPFSHDHHVAGLGIDCRYCHTSVEHTDFAGMPSTQTCMNCHQQIWPNADLLQPVRESWDTGQRIQWNRVTNVPDFVYFNHAIHVRKGVGCETCHGRVDRMPLIYQANPMYMQWCLRCHREPERFIRPREEVYTFGYQPEQDQLALGQQLVDEYGIQTKGLTDCSVCHR